jgi:hypothetical protein
MLRTGDGLQTKFRDTSVTLALFFHFVGYCRKMFVGNVGPFADPKSGFTQPTCEGFGVLPDSVLFRARAGQGYPVRAQYQTDGFHMNLLPEVRQNEPTDPPMARVRHTTTTRDKSMSIPDRRENPENSFNKGCHHAGSFVLRIKRWPWGNYDNGRFLDTCRLSGGGVVFQPGVWMRKCAVWK